MPSSEKPSHIVGRSELTGPVSGVYQSFTFLIPDIAIGETAFRCPVIKLPWDFAPLQVQVSAETIGGATTAQMDVKYHASDITAGTSILGAHLDISATPSTVAIAGSNSGDDTTITEGIRIPAGYLLYGESNAAGGTVGDCTLVISGYILGHINDDPLDDISAPNSV